jgi:hypothetical protein
MGTRFVDVPADAILGELRAIASAVQGKRGYSSEGVAGREIVFDIGPPGGVAVVRVYTSLALGEDAVRDCGEDAVRLVLGAVMPSDTGLRFKPLGESRRIYRTAPKGTADERVAVFMKRLRDAIREFYAMALRVPSCPSCGGPLVRRESRDGRAFLGCARYPVCRGTRPA